MEANGSKDQHFPIGPTIAIADPLSRLARQENQLDNLDLPLMLEMFLNELPASVRNALSIRLNAEKDTIVSLV